MVHTGSMARMLGKARPGQQFRSQPITTLLRGEDYLWAALRVAGSWGAREAEPLTSQALPTPGGGGVVEEGPGLLARGHWEAGGHSPLSCLGYHALKALSSFNSSVTSGYDPGVVLYIAWPGRFTGHPHCWTVNVS